MYVRLQEFPESSTKLNAAERNVRVVTGDINCERKFAEVAKLELLVKKRPLAHAGYSMESNCDLLPGQRMRGVLIYSLH